MICDTLIRMQPRRRRLSARSRTAVITTVSVDTLYQVVHDATVYGPGQTADVPQDVAQTWIDAGWVSEPKVTKAAPPKRTR